MLSTALRSRHIVWRRSVFVMSYQKRKKPPKKEKLQEWADEDTARLMRKEQAEYKKKLKELRDLTRSVATFVKARDAEKSEQQKYRLLKLPSDSAGALDSPKFDASAHSLATPTVALPQSITDKLGLAVRYLVSKENQNWPLVLHQLEQADGFKGVSERDVRKLVYAIPKRELAPVFPVIEKLLADAGMQTSPKIVNEYLKSLVAGPVTLDKIETVEKYVEQLRKDAPKGKLSRGTYEVLVEAYGKGNMVPKMEAVIKEMQAHKLLPLPHVYTNVLATCVYKTRDHRQAVQLFDLMKFLGGLMAPGTREYQDVIVSYVNHDDIEKALDLYQEMVLNKTELNQSILIALARGCASREQLRFKAWEFMFDIYKMNWQPSVHALEYMLYLAAKDGDLSLARALYQQLTALGATLPRSFGFLMLAYSHCSLTRPDEDFKVPAITMHETGRNFRRNMLQRVDFTPNLEDPLKAVPYLPQVVLTSASEVLAESSAVVAHALLVNPAFVTVDNVNTYLNVAAKLGLLSDFVDRYNEFTFLDTTGIPETRVEPEIMENLTEEMDSLLAIVGIEKKQETSVTKSPVLTELAKSPTASHKVPRDTLTYIIALRAAAKHGDYSFSQALWTERGRYRKSDNFKILPRDQKDKLDFNFATAMVNALTDMKLLDDALAILVSTEYQFKWSWKELRPFYTAAVNVGYDKVTRTIRGIVKRALINHEGKIRKKDYKRYVMERGY